jgi:hypothetical protein
MKEELRLPLCALITANICGIANSRGWEFFLNSIVIIAGLWLITKPRAEGFKREVA